MNCEPGDLAIIVRGNNRDRLVTVKHLLSGFPEPTWLAEALQPMLMSSLSGGEVRMVPPGWLGAIEDSRLRPLRDTDGEDEMIKIAGRAPVFEEAVS